MVEAERILRGLSDPPRYSTFIDVNDLQDSSNKDWLDKVEVRDYRTFGEIRKVSSLNLKENEV